MLKMKKKKNNEAKRTKRMAKIIGEAAMW